MAPQTDDRSLTEMVVLALLVEEPSHGFALARQLEPGTDLGRILTVRRSLVYRALDRLVAAGLADIEATQPGESGPVRIPHRATAAGRRAVSTWLHQPVDHIRDMRIELLVKLRLLERAGRDPGSLISRQREQLAGPLDTLTAEPVEADVVDRWRHHSALAARRFLADLGP